MRGQERVFGEVAERQRWPEGLWLCLLQHILQICGKKSLFSY